jgi:hypothetical protein
VAQRWVLLIYTVPAEPSRMRAAIWRALKRVGAVYLRAGVAAIPEHGETLVVFRELASRATSYGGRATVVAHAELDAVTATELMTQLRAERRAEYDDLRRETEQFLFHLRQEHGHRQLHADDVAVLRSDLGKLENWAAQIRARDYLDDAEPAALDGLFRACGEEIGADAQGRTRQVHP